MLLPSRRILINQLNNIVQSDDGGCVLLEGESECGKSSLLHLLAKLHKKEESMIVVHLGEQIDSKVQVLIT